MAQSHTIKFNVPSGFLVGRATKPWKSENKKENWSIQSISRFDALNEFQINHWRKKNNQINCETNNAAKWPEKKKNLQMDDLFSMLYALHRVVQQLFQTFCSALCCGVLFAFSICFFLVLLTNRSKTQILLLFHTAERCSFSIYKKTDNKSN